jgi:hypothetical protein
VRPLSVEDHSEHPPDRFSAELNLEDLETETAGNPPRNFPDLGQEIFVAHRHARDVLQLHKHKKWANAHFCRIDVP